MNKSNSNEPQRTQRTQKSAEFIPLQHTPGPWHVSPIGDEKYIGTAQGYIADMCRNKCDNEAQLAMCDANARLIAAAPELLAALEYVFERLDDAVDFGVLDKSPFYPSWQKVRAAIAKARGITPTQVSQQAHGVVAAKHETAAEMLKQFPRMTHNDNVLEDIACPTCGHRDGFTIEGTTNFDVEDEGSSGNEGDHTWEDHSRCRCNKCDHRGTVRDFTFEGLDDLIAETAENA